MASEADLARHWDDAYAQGVRTRSWFQQHPAMSLRMLAAAGVSAGDSVLDVGGGASPLADALLHRGYADVTVLDISAAGIGQARERLGPEVGRVRWLTADILTWQPGRRYDTWHDRAVFHFLTDTRDQRRYLATLGSATAAEAAVVLGCFAPDGPQHCSSLPVARWSPEQLARQLGDHWTLIASEREEHITPAGVVQPFTWAAFRRLPRSHPPAAPQ